MWPILKVIGLITLCFFTGCATDPGTNSPIAGSAVTYFTFARGEMDILISASGSRITAGAVLFDINTTTQERARATHVEEGVTIDWPSSVAVSIPGCSAPAELESSETYETYKLFFYVLPSACASSPTNSISGFASVTIHKEGQSRTLNDAGNSGGEEGSHQVFVTTATYNGNLGGLSGADAKCQSEADGALLGGTWKAILSNGGVSAASRISIAAAAPVYNMLGELVATGPGELWSGTVLNKLAYDTSGNLLPLTEVWTGSNGNGLGAAEHCLDWFIDAGVQIGIWGMPADLTPTSWISASTHTCDNLLSLLCISE